MTQLNKAQPDWSVSVFIYHWNWIDMTWFGLFAKSPATNLPCIFHMHVQIMNKLEVYIYIYYTEISLSVTRSRPVFFSCFTPQYNWPPRYNWNIVECGVKHNNSNPQKWGSDRPKTTGTTTSDYHWKIIGSSFGWQI